MLTDMRIRILARVFRGENWKTEQVSTDQTATWTSMPCFDAEMMPEYLQA